MKKQHGPCMDRRVHIAEIPFIARNLPAGMQVNPVEHQCHLMLGELRVHDGERQRMKRQIPRRIPQIFPLEMTSLLIM